MRILFFTLMFANCFCDIQDRFKTIEENTTIAGIKNVDYIYLINLDKRPEQLEKSLRQLAPYGIRPFRFSAVSGEDLSIEALNDVGLKFLSGMEGNQWVVHYSYEKNGAPEYDFLRDECIGQTYFSCYTPRDQIGLALSNFSILQHAYDAGYQTIWVMQDDIEVIEDPHQLSDLIEQLDLSVGTEGWDILYTDNDGEDLDSDLTKNLWWMWRSDFLPSHLHPFTKRTKINDTFSKIGSRTKTHSLIIRRSGMRKILNHAKTRGIFLPIDHELPFVPGIQMYMLRHPIVTWMNL